MCVANAQNKYNQAKTQAKTGFWKGFAVGVGVTTTLNAAAGCAVGAGVSVFALNTLTEFTGARFSWQAGEVGCVVGGVDAALNGLVPSLVTGAVVGGIVYALDASDANSALKNDLQACSQIP